MGPSMRGIRRAGPRRALAIALVACAGLSILAGLAPRASAALLSVTSPAKGDVWTTGATHQVIWTSDVVDPGVIWPITVSYFVAGVLAGDIGTTIYGYGGVGSVPWDVPTADLYDVTVRVCVDPGAGTQCIFSAPFTVHGIAPSVTARSPEGVNINAAAPISLTFSRPMNTSAVEGALSLSPTPIGGGTWIWDANDTTASVGFSLQEGTSYTATLDCGARDVGNLGNEIAGCPIVWSFRTSIAPTIGLVWPRAGDRWTGGSVHRILWSANDPEDGSGALRVDLRLNPSGSAIASGLPGNQTFDWTVPTLDGTNLTILATVVDTSGLRASDQSDTFAIDSTSPTVTAVTPANGAIDVGWTAPIVVGLSEMGVAPLDEIAFGVRDSSGTWVAGSMSWDNAQTFRFTPSVPLAAATAYEILVNGSMRDASDPGNALIPYSSSFTTKSNGAPSISITSAFPPILSGGSTRTLRWTASDPEDLATQLKVYVEFSDGGPFVTLAGPLATSSSYDFTTPVQDLLGATLRVRVVDSQGGTGTSSLTFAVDATPPTITLTSPPEGAIDVTPDTSISITFSEAVVGALAEVRDTATGHLVPQGVTFGSGSRIIFRLGETLLEGHEYEVFLNGTVTDRSSPGNPLVGPRSWRFRVLKIPPVVAILGPAPGARWSAGVAHLVHVSSADAQDPTVQVSVDLAVDGVLFIPLVSASMPRGEANFSVMAPDVDASSGVLRVCATDAAGATACVGQDIELDGTPPRVTQTSPPAGDRRVASDAPIIITFSESMVPPSVESALSIEPAIPWSARWTRSSSDNDTIVLEHPPFRTLQTYLVSLGCAARDTSVPGLAFRGGCPVSITFTIANPPKVDVVFPAGGERLTGGVDQTIRWTLTAQDAAVRATVDLSTDGGATFPVRLVDGDLVPTNAAEVRVVLPAVDVAAAVTRVTVVDSVGLTSTDVSGAFAIDASPPRILSSSPADGALGVSQQADVIVVFSESMAPVPLDPSVLAAFPAFQDVVSKWSSTNVPSDTVRIAHAILYTDAVSLTFNGLRDASSPGNPATLRLSFSVFWDHEAPQIRMRVDNDTMEGREVVLDASASTDNVAIASFTWRIYDEGGFLLDTLRGATASWKATKAGSLNVTVDVVDTSGNAARSSRPLYVHLLPGHAELPPNASVTLLGWLALAGAGGSSSYGFTDRGRSFLSRAFLLPLYVRMKGEKVMNHETRGMIRGYILVHPGDCYTDIKRNLGLANGELAYHLSVLEREGIIQSTTRGARRLFYPADVPIPENGGGLHEVQQRILRHVREVPGMSVRDLAGLLGVSSQLAIYHVRQLREYGLVRIERERLRFLVYAVSAEERLRAGTPDT